MTYRSLSAPSTPIAGTLRRASANAPQCAGVRRWKVGGDARAEASAIRWRSSFVTAAEPQFPRGRNTFRVRIHPPSSPARGASGPGGSDGIRKPPFAGDRFLILIAAMTRRASGTGTGVCIFDYNNDGLLDV